MIDFIDITNDINNIIHIDIAIKSDPQRRKELRARKLIMWHDLIRKISRMIKQEVKNAKKE